jgi:phosphoenolpyruvate---glycerone phosphotransferase subunit DhaL
MNGASGWQMGLGSIAASRGATYTRSTVSATVAADHAIDAAAVRAAVGRCLAIVERHAAYLTRLDQVLGDADHGENLLIGFRAADARLAELPPETSPGALLQAAGHRLVAAVGGASGPLYGTAFLEAGVVAGDEATLDATTVAAALRAAERGLARRGRCAVGDKTILDALAPASSALSEGVAAGAPIGSAYAAAVRAAARGARSTRPLVARRGLALRLGERSTGHLDPGAVSCLLLLRALGGD